MQGAVLGARGRQVPRPRATWLAGRRPGKEASYVKAGPAAEPGCSEPRRARPGHGRSGSRSLGARGPSRAQPPAWRRSVPPKPRTLRTWRPDPGLRADGRRGAQGPVAPGGRSSERGPQCGGRAQPAQRTGVPEPRAPRKRNPLGTPRPPRAEKLPGGGGKAGRAAAWRPGWRWRPARRCAGDSAREEAAAQGSPPPFAGGTEAPRSCGGAHAQTLSEAGQPRPGFPPARGRGPPQFFRTPRLEQPSGTWLWRP